MSDARERPLSIAMLALGGQGGGVLTGWLVETAEANGYIAQSTYVAGVAQRTRHHLGASIVAVQTRLGHEYPDLLVHLPLPVYRLRRCLP